MSNTKKLIAVVGATGQQGGAVVRALQASGQFKVRALTRNPDKHPELADEVVAADLNRPEALQAAFAGAHGVFLVTNAWEAGNDESKRALAAVDAQRLAVRPHMWEGRAARTSQDKQRFFSDARATPIPRSDDHRKTNSCVRRVAPSSKTRDMHLSLWG